MARKRLIKGANAARVEERIARVPIDVAGPAAAPESSIFGALRALEDGAAAPPRSLPPKKIAAYKRISPTIQAARGRKAESVKTPSPAPKPVPRPTPIPKAGKSEKVYRLGPSDFNAEERETIVRCCSDYKNRLPTYLLAAQKEVKLLDSVIDKCRAAKDRPRKP